MLGAFFFGALFGLAVLAGCVSDESEGQPSPTGSMCAAYCEAVTTNCTGALRAYDSRIDCEKTCAFMRVGVEGDQENTVGCRLAHAKIGGSATECRAANAYGGGVCGQRCEAFCALADANCTQPLGKSVPFASKADCSEACKAMTYDEALGEGPEAVVGDNLNCRMYHLLLSVGGREPHCAHASVPSDVCK